MELSTIPSLASGAFSGGPKDELASVDIYKVKSAVSSDVKPITSVQELSAAIDKYNNDLILDTGIASSFMSKATEPGKLDFDKDTLTNRILGTSNEFKACVNELNESIKTGALTATLKDKAKYVMCTINETRSLVDAAKIGDVASLGKFVNKYTGTAAFSGKDKGALSGLLSSVVTTSSNLGISGAFTSLANTVNDNGIIGRMTRAVLPIAIQNSDFKLLKEITNGPGGSLINVFSPGFTQKFSKAFTYQGNQAKSLDSFEDIFGAFKNVNEAWDLLQRGDQDNFAVNLLSIMGGSRDFKNLVMTGVKYWATEQGKADGKRPKVPINPMYALASAFPEVTVGQAIQRDFPRVALLSVYNQRLPRRNGTPTGSRNKHNLNFMDPRLVSGALGALFG